MSKKNRNRRAPSEAEAGQQLLESSFAALWDAIDSGDLLRAEVEAASLLAVPVRADAPADQTREYIQSILRTVAVRQPTPTGAACFRIMASVGSADAKRAAGEALGNLTADGIFAPEWATETGKPVPVQAWRSYDVFGDTELIVVTFGYGDSEHALVATVNRTVQPVVTMLAIVADAAEAINSVREASDPMARQEELSLAAARRHLEEPLATAAGDPLAYLDQEPIGYLAIARSRVRRLPAEAGEAAVTFTAAARAAAVTEFLASPQAAEAGDADSARFWAEVLTGYSGRIPEESPTRVGPGTLAAAVLGHVPSTFTLSAAQRSGLEPAVTAWVRWAVERQGVDEAAVAHLMAEVPKIVADFDKAYDDPRNAAARAYVADLATSDADFVALDEVATRRAFAEPHPGGRGRNLDSVDATTADGRSTLVAAEFEGCMTGPEATKKLVATATDVIEELWSGEPSSTWDEAEKLSASGMSRHDVLHSLVNKR